MTKGVSVDELIATVALPAAAEGHPAELVTVQPRTTVPLAPASKVTRLVCGSALVIVPPLIVQTYDAPEAMVPAVGTEATLLVDREHTPPGAVIVELGGPLTVTAKAKPLPLQLVLLLLTMSVPL
jgi:hypothetical protein